MQKLDDELPPGPFFDAIREWNAGVKTRREKAGIPDDADMNGLMYVSPEMMKLLRDAGWPGT